MAVTAKVVCANKTTSTPDGSGSALFSFYANYADGNNKEWAAATPYLELKMSVKNGDLFTVGQSYTLTFEEDNPTNEAR